MRVRTTYYIYVTELIRLIMPITASKKGGGTKKRSFGQLVGDFKKQGKSDQQARRIVGKMQRDQELGRKRKKRH